MFQLVRGAVTAFTLGLLTAGAFAQQPNDAAQKEMEAAFEAASAVKQSGPTDVKLASEAVFHVPEGFVFIPQAQAVRLLKAMGNRPSPELLGMVFPKGETDNWFATVRYISSGYIKDDDAKDWNAKEMLEQIQEGTEISNKERKARGLPEMAIVGWVEKPTYDAANHRLVWSIESRDKVASADSENGINYNTFLLGREGYVSLNFVTEMKVIESQKPIARQLLGSIEFDKGRAYADFNSSTDRMAEYGLAALVGGVAAKKLGLFAVIAAFFMKFIKVIAFAGVALLAGIAKFFTGKKE